MAVQFSEAIEAKLCPTYWLPSNVAGTGERQLSGEIRELPLMADSTHRLVVP
jgi:hypothetical protein